MSSSAEHDSSKFTNRNGQGDYFVASSTYIHTYRGSNKREAKVRDQERVREREREREQAKRGGPEGGIQQDVRVRPFGIVCTPELWENFHTWKY